MPAKVFQAKVEGQHEKGAQFWLKQMTATIFQAKVE